MKKFISFVLVFFISGAVALQGKKIRYLISEKPQTKKFQFSIFAGTDYSGRLYKKSKASVVLTICKFSGNKQEVLWEGKIDEANIKDYPLASDPLYREVSVYNVFDKKETIAAFYKVTYKVAGSKFSYEKGISLCEGTNTERLIVAL
jgi:hypothetical protein